MMVLAVLSLCAESDAMPQSADPVTEKVLAGVSGNDQDAKLAKGRWCILCGNCCNTEKEKEAQLALQR